MMDILVQICTHTAVPAGTLEYQLFRDLAVTRSGSPVCEVYGICVTRRSDIEAETCTVENVTTDYDQAMELLDTLALGQVEPVHVQDVLYNLISQSA